ncbi:MAG: oligosaccharide flippase family protein [Opitutaceae bacterium]
MKAEPDPRAPGLRRQLLRGGALLTGGKAVTQGCSFLRSIIVARAIGVENFGIAATFSVTVAVFDMLGTVSADRLLIQAKDGNEERFQGAAHMVHALRGIVSGLLIALLAPVMANVFGVPQATWAFRYLALVPVLRGFVHLDNQRIQREFKYGQSVILDVAQQLIPALLAWPIAIWLHSYSAVLWLVLLQMVVATVGSYLIADRPYRWCWDAVYLRRIFSFGWPIAANAFLIFGIYQGDRFLIGAAPRLFGAQTFSMKDLGIFAVATSLTLTPLIAFSTIASSLLLPVFSSFQSNLAELTRRYRVSGQIVGLISGCFAIPLIVAGPAIVTTLYGKSYAAAGVLIGWMAAAQAVRMSRIVPTIAAMSTGDTMNGMYANILRFCSVFATAAIIIARGKLTWIAMAGFGGELAGMGVCLWKLDRDCRIPASYGLKCLAAVLIGMVVAGGIATCTRQLGLLAQGGLTLGIGSLFIGVMLVAFPALRIWIFGLCASKFGRKGTQGPRPIPAVGA